MSTPEKEATKAVDDADDAAANGGDDDNHEEAAEILTDLVQNQMSISSADTTQIAEAQATALQLLLQQGGASASKQQSMQALLDAARKGDIVAQQQLMGQVASNGEEAARLLGYTGEYFIICVHVLPYSKRTISVASQHLNLILYSIMDHRPTHLHHLHNIAHAQLG
jgi:hypothetical protein